MTAVLTLQDLWRSLHEDSASPFAILQGRSTTHGEFCAAVQACLAAYRDAGLASGDRVVIFVPDEMQAAAAFAAALFAGHVPVMIAPDSAPARLDAVCNAVEAARLIITGTRPPLSWRGPTIDLADKMLRRLGPEDLDIPSAVAVAEPDALAYLLFTSGTTANPSGVEITVGNLLSHLATLRRLFGFDRSTRVFNPVPLAHTDGLVLGPLLALASGGSLIRPGPFDATDVQGWLAGLRRHGATHMVTNPTVLNLIERFATDDHCFRYPEFRGIICSASLLSGDQWARFETRFGTQIWNLYGLTETVTTALYAGRHTEMGAIGTIGVPIDCEARLGSRDGRPIAADAVPEGEIQLRGAHIFRGYWRNAERTAQTFTPDGWMRTGDLARRRRDGSYEFLGRLKAAINSGGTLIRGEEVDEALLRHAAVLESTTVGISDPDFEEIAVSAVVLSRPTDEAALTAHCRVYLETLKVPKRIVAVDSIPRGPSGKPRLAEVKGMLEARIRPNAPQASASSPAPIEAQVIDLAAVVFRAEPSNLSMESTPESVTGWDSFTHVNLILQAEMDFGLRIPNRHVKSIRSLGDLAGIVAKLRQA
jgi:acyl-CoA synthetase (AMP-forming)/AMP-acid ligase II/acyl carrier protein